MADDDPVAGWIYVAVELFKMLILFFARKSSISFPRRSNPEQPQRVLCELKSPRIKTRRKLIKEFIEVSDVKRKRWREIEGTYGYGFL